MYKTANPELIEPIRTSILQSLTAARQLLHTTSDIQSTQGQTSGLTSPEKERLEYQDSPQVEDFAQSSHINKEQLNKLIDICLSPDGLKPSAEERKCSEEDNRLIKLIDDRIMLFKQQLKHELTDELDSDLKAKIKQEISSFLQSDPKLAEAIASGKNTEPHTQEEKESPTATSADESPQVDQ